MDGTYVSGGISIKFTKDSKFSFKEIKEDTSKSVIGIYEKNGEKIKLKGSGVEVVGKEAQEFLLDTEVDLKNYKREDSFDGTYVFEEGELKTQIKFTKDLKFTFNEFQSTTTRTVIGTYHKEGDLEKTQKNMSWKNIKSI
eukprot:gene3369-5916_t